MTLPHLSFDDVISRLKEAQAFHPGKLAMYSSHWQGIVTDPRLMLVPVDDHLVHRGDGVFETLLYRGGRLYNLQAHLQRLTHSATTLGLALPLPQDGLAELIAGVMQAAGRDHALCRVLLGRGPGGFGVDPAECPEASLYIIAYPAPAPFMERVPEGARVVYSRIPPKSGGLAQVKTCNYLPNVLMKAEATARGAHFVLGLDTDGFLTESYTENFAAVDAAGTLVIPPATHHLPGTTLQRVSELARQTGMTVCVRPLRPEDLAEMRELLIVGTTAYVTSVTWLEGQVYPIGPVARKLSEALLTEILSGAGPA